MPRVQLSYGTLANPYPGYNLYAYQTIRWGHFGLRDLRTTNHTLGNVNIGYGLTTINKFNADPATEDEHVKGSLQMGFTQGNISNIFIVIYFYLRFAGTMATNTATISEIECPICYEHFKQPMFLPWSHSYCLECLENWQVKLVFSCYAV